MLIYHGDEDRVVPAENSTELAAIFKQVDGPHFYPGAGHNDLLFPGMSSGHHGRAHSPYTILNDFLGKAMLYAHEQSCGDEQDPIESGENNDVNVVRSAELAN